VAAPGDIILKEWGIAVGSTVNAGGRFTVRNEGSESHDLVVSRADGTPVDTTGLLDAGATAALSLPATGEDYVFTCRLVEVEPDGTYEDHLEKGMEAGAAISPSGARP